MLGYVGVGWCTTKVFPVDAIVSGIALQFPNILRQSCLVGFRWMGDARLMVGIPLLESGVS